MLTCKYDAMDKMQFAIDSLEMPWHLPQIIIVT